MISHSYNSRGSILIPGSDRLLELFAFTFCYILNPPFFKFRINIRINIFREGANLCGDRDNNLYSMI